MDRDDEAGAQRPDATAARLRELAALFLKLGLTGLGGPAVHIAMLEAETVRRRRWLSAESFLDLVAATNLIPGPNSTEMAIHIGYLRAGWAGLLVAGACFITPAALLTLGLAYLYMRYGARPAVQPILHGMQAAVVAVVLTAVFHLRGAVLRRRGLTLVAAAALLLALAGLPELGVLAGGGGLYALGEALWRRRRGESAAGLLPVCAAALALAAAAALPLLLAGGPAPPATLSLGRLGLFFLKVGSLIYGSGYVLVAFLQRGLVEGAHWLPQQALLDAVAAGQVTPGPVFSTATFVGYVLLGLPGAAVATAGIFLPAFVLVGLLAQVLGRLRALPWLRPLLDGVGASSLALMAAVGLKLIPAMATTPARVAVTLAVTALGAALRLNASWLVLLGGVLGAVLGL